MPSDVSCGTKKKEKITQGTDTVMFNISTENIVKDDTGFKR